MKPHPKSVDAAFERRVKRLLFDLSYIERLQPLADHVRDFCDAEWNWDAFVFSIRRGRASFHFRNVTVIDTINGERQDFEGIEHNVSSLSPTWQNLLKGKPVLINRDGRNEMVPRLRFGDTSRTSACLIFVPIVLGNLVVGAISIQSYTRDQFGASDRDKMLYLADNIAAHVLRCRASERMLDFFNLGKQLNQAKDTNGVSRAVADAAGHLLGWDAMAIHLFGPMGNVLHRVMGLQRLPDVCQISPSRDDMAPESEGAVQLVRSGQVVRVNLESLTANGREWFSPFGDELPLLTSFMAAPIRSMNQVIGMLTVQNQSADAYAEEEETILNGLAELCSGALDRAWAQQNLQASEENYRLVVENVNDGIVISQDDRFVFFNDRFASMLGYSDAELRAKTYLDVYTQRGLEILQQRTAFRSAGLPVPDRYETLFRTKTGEVVPVEANVRIIEDFNGRPATFAVVRDITERKMHEKKLHESEQELRALFAAMTDIILVLDTNGHCRNREVGRQHLMYTPWQGLLNDCLEKVFSPEKGEYLLRMIRKSVQTRETLNVEFDLDSESGIRVWYNATFSPMGDDTVLLVARDVTERRRAEEELFRRNAQYKALLDGSADYIFVLDRDMRFVHVNSVIEQRYGATANMRIGKRFEDIFIGRPLPHYYQKIKDVFRTGRPIIYDDDAVVNGELICTETMVSPVCDMSGQVEAVLGVSRDVTSRRQSAIALKRSEERYAGATRATNDGIWDWDLESNLIYLSPRWWAIMGEQDNEVEGEYPADEWFNRVHAEDLPDLKKKINDHLQGLTPHLQDEHRMRHVNGEWRWVLCRGLCITEGSTEPVRMAGSISDITDRKAAEALLLYGATHDVLTNLPNRAHFLKSLQRVMTDIKSNRAKGLCAVLFLDLDRFKVVNDSLGHLAGDDLIFETARRLERCVRPGDLVARMGGDEFTVMLTGVCKESDVSTVANRIISELAAPVEIGGFRVQTTVSMGIAFFRPEYSQPDDLLRDADTAMYRAKAAGRNRYQIFDQQMHATVMAQLQWEADLRQSVANNDFELHYQPIYRLPQRRLTGFECLIRWNHPRLGLTTPDRFIELAEETGLIVPIGWWVLDQAMRDCHKWNQGRPENERLTVSVNISPRQFLQPNLLEHVLFMLHDSHALPTDLIFEITESLLMEDSADVARHLSDLRQTGIRLDLDDFGTGYSSLSFLRRFPLDLLKIDRSFIQDLPHGSSSDIVEAILALARGLHLPVTAEGVETAEQLEMLIQMGCDFAQGYYFSPPVRIEKVMELIAADPLPDDAAVS